MTEGIYELDIFHARTKPVAQRFNIKGYNVFVDVARFDEGGALGFFHQLKRRDFSLFNDAAKTATEAALEFLHSRSGIAADRVYLLAHPRIFGYVFNPVSFFFYYEAQRHVATVIEVNNTFGEQKHFIQSATVKKSAARKDFYVSPFISPFAEFRMRIEPPGEGLTIGIHTHGKSDIELVAEMRGVRRPLTKTQLVRMFFKYPLHTVRVIVLIHWFALKLFFKRVPHYPKDGADAAVLHQNLRSQV